jgi:hypothetical protein
MFIVKPVVKRIGRFRPKCTDNEFRKDLTGVSLDDFKPYGCIVGGQAAGKNNNHRLKIKNSMENFIHHLLTGAAALTLTAKTATLLPVK